MDNLLGMFGDDADDVPHHLQEPALDTRTTAPRRRRAPASVPSPSSVMNGAWCGRIPTWPSYAGAPEDFGLAVEDGAVRER